MEKYFVYILRCLDNSLYTGITPDIKRRIGEHLSKDTKGAKYTKSHTPVALEALWTCKGKSAASKLECRIKRLKKQKKEELILNSEMVFEFFPELCGLEYEKAEIFNINNVLHK